jgi:hypothetical protein
LWSASVFLLALLSVWRFFMVGLCFFCRPCFRFGVFFVVGLCFFVGPFLGLAIFFVVSHCFSIGLHFRFGHVSSMGVRTQKKSKAEPLKKRKKL